jgi:hypothetical protein
MTLSHVHPNRRRHLASSIAHDRIQYQCRGGSLEDGTPAEIFLSSAKPGCVAETEARGAASAVSIGLQNGVPLPTLRHTISRASNGAAVGPIGLALDILDEMNAAHSQD